MYFINRMVNYFDRKYGVPINIFFENLTRLRYKPPYEITGS